MGHSGFSISMLYLVQGATFESIGRLVNRDEASLDIFWLTDETIEESDNLPALDMSALEAEIDQLVYSLYGLTREEIAIIEESLQQRTGSREVADDAELEQETRADMEFVGRKSVLKVVIFLWSLERQKTSISTD